MLYAQYLLDSDIFDTDMIMNGEQGMSGVSIFPIPRISFEDRERRVLSGFVSMKWS
jgi:hypothetical protein